MQCGMGPLRQQAEAAVSTIDKLGVNIVANKILSLMTKITNI